MRAKQHKKVVFYCIKRKVKHLFVLPQTVLPYKFDGGHAAAGHKPAPTIEDKKHAHKSTIYHEHKLQVTFPLFLNNKISYGIRKLTYMWWFHIDTIVME